MWKTQGFHPFIDFSASRILNLKLVPAGWVVYRCVFTVASVLSQRPTRRTCCGSITDTCPTALSTIFLVVIMTISLRYDIIQVITSCRSRRTWISCSCVIKCTQITYIWRMSVPTLCAWFAARCEKTRKCDHHLKTCSHARAYTWNPRSEQELLAQSADSMYLL